MPTLTVYSPVAGQAVNMRDIYISLKATAPNGIARVVFMLDGVTVTTTYQYPYDTTIHATKVLAGEHKIKVVAFDVNGVSINQEIPILLNVTQEPATIDWTERGPVTVKNTDFPRAFAITPYRWDAVRNVKVYLGEGTSEKLIYTFVQGQDQLSTANQLTFTWKHSPGTGTYLLRAVMTDSEGVIVERMLDVTVE
jgi:hypothetical protein